MTENKTWLVNGFDRDMREISHWAEIPQLNEHPKELCIVMEKSNFISSLKAENKKGFKDEFINGYHKGIDEALEKLGKKLKS